MDVADSLTWEGACPSRSNLIAFIAGELSQQELQSISAHLAGCRRCRAFLGTMKEEEAKLLPALPEPSVHPPSAGNSLSPTVTAAERWINTPLPRELKPPFVLGQYQVVEKIGQGGMGSVYRAIHPRLKKEYAVKILRSECTANPQAVARFEREMEAIGRLDHNNIVRATDAGEVNGVYYLVMELVAGIDLARLVRLRGPLAVADACALVRLAAVGLQCAHENGLVHRDVKPSNLVLSAKGELKVLDLGLALLNSNGLDSEELTKSGQVMGTPDYTAPEQWDNCHSVDIRADIYSLGCTLYTLLVGRPPFPRPHYTTDLQKKAAHLREPVPPLAGQRPDVPVDLERLLAAMVAKEPAARPSTPAEVALALEPFSKDADLPALASQALVLPSCPVSSTVQTTVTRDLTPHRETPQHLSGSPDGRSERLRSRRVGVTALAILLTGIVAAAVSFWQRSSQPGTAGLTPDPTGWQNLLAKPPGKRLWIPGVDSRLNYIPDKQRLEIQTFSRVLIPLGQTTARGYKLQVGFRQPRWIGYFGVYYGGKPKPVPDPYPFHFQFIALDPDSGQNPQTFTLIRSTGAIAQEPVGRPATSTDQVASAALFRPLDNHEVLLEVEVKPGGLSRVRWNNDDYWKLVNVSPRADLVLKGMDEQGEFGIYCFSTNVTVSTARFLPTE